MGDEYKKYHAPHPPKAWIDAGTKKELSAVSVSIAGVCADIVLPLCSDVWNSDRVP